jgi:integrase/recombinase XerD
VKRSLRQVEPLRPLDPVGMESAIIDYIEALRVRNYSASTLVSRRHHLVRFTAWCTERSLLRPSEITRPILESYQRWLFHYRRPGGQALSFRTQSQIIVSVRGLFRFLTRQGVLLTNPAADLDPPREEKRLPGHVLTAEEADLILNQPNVHDVLGLRDRAILETLYSTGVRRLELVNLLTRDLEINRQTVFVRLGKGKKDRVVPIGERALAWVCKYLYEARPRLMVEPDCGHLFLNITGGPLAPFTLGDLVRRYLLAAGVTKPGACHIFRHTMATLMLEGGADIRFIQEMLGHANLQTTQIYTRVSIQKLKAIHDATHPGARLRRAPQRVKPAATTTEPTPADVLSALAAEADEDNEG